MKHEKEINNVRKAVDELLKAIGADQTVDDEELQAILDLEDETSEKLTEFLSAHGIEIGDERVD